VVAEGVGLAAAVREADLVMTGEGLLDVQSFEGKVVGSVAALATAAGVPWCAVVGQAAVHPDGADVIDLVATFGRDAALTQTLHCLRTAARDHLNRLPVPPGRDPVPGPSDPPLGDAT
jgi:glycerate kinase